MEDIYMILPLIIALIANIVAMIALMFDHKTLVRIQKISKEMNSTITKMQKIIDGKFKI